MTVKIITIDLINEVKNDKKMMNYDWGDIFVKE